MRVSSFSTFCCLCSPLQITNAGIEKRPSMKRCPTCKRTFEDDTLSYCLDDGTPLVAAARPDSEETLVLPSSSDRGARIPDTQPYKQPSGRATLASDPWKPATPQQYMTPSPQSSVWPWLLAISVVLLLG